MSAPEPRHFARDGYVVVCGGALCHHDGAFTSPDAAENWAENAHCCPGRHQVVQPAALLAVRRLRGCVLMADYSDFITQVRAELAEQLWLTERGPRRPTDAQCRADNARYDAETADVPEHPETTARGEHEDAYAEYAADFEPDAYNPDDRLDGYRPGFDPKRWDSEDVPF